MGKKIRCGIDETDWVKVEVEEGSAYVELDISLGEKRDYLLLTPSDARKLRKQIKKALEAIEGVDEEPAEEAKREIKVGDKVRIVGNKYPTNNRDSLFLGPHGHSFRIGDIVEIKGIDYSDLRQTYDAGGQYGWLAAEDIEPA